MRKIALLIVMVFAFSLTQASNHAVANNVANNNAVLQATTMAIQNTNMQTVPAFQITTATEAEMNSGNHAARTKHPRADKKPRVKKTRQHKSAEARKAAHEKKVQQRKARQQKDRAARKAEHHKVKNGEHHHRNRSNK